MSLATVLAAITWPTESTSTITPIGVNNPLRAQIIGYITNLYNSSPNHAALILESAAMAGHLNFLQSSDGNHSITIGGIPAVAFDFGQISNLFYFNNTGTLVPEMPELAVIHEIIHLTPLSDPLPDGFVPTNAQMSAGFDFDGDVVREQNKVASEMGHNGNIQRNYYASMEFNSLLYNKFTPNFSYSEET
jgi:hypothetical protein